MDKAILEVRNLKKYFPITGGLLSRKIGDVKAVDDISFKINKGEIFGLVGESGCGKSTTGRSILNLLNPTSGYVEFDGKVLFDSENDHAISKNEMRQMRKKMQIIFQDPSMSLDPRMSAGSIVSEGLKEHKIYDKNEIAGKTAEILEKCGLNKAFINKYPHEFSGGQKQRIGIARALALKPSFIVCDEPIAALDVSIQAQILKLMKSLKDEFELTYLFISHDLSVVKYFCDSIGVMYLGSFVEKASSKALFANPMHPYTKSLLSAVPKSNPREKKERILLKGDIPSPVNPPSGCKFHTRCPVAMEKCSKEIPVMKELEKDHFVSCHLYE
jgi:oligopeptide/dipeptide ABC transporter ATP-binding protein